MTARRVLGSLVALAACWSLIASARAAAPVDEETVQRIAAGLRCVVCQNLSVADSPSETANQMRAIIRERLAAGETPEQVTRYFVEKYGIWILLSPPAQGFNVLVWVVPFAALGLGLVVVVALARRWRRRAAATNAARLPVSDAMRERIAREIGES